MDAHKPDLQSVDPEVRAYIEALEAEVERLRRNKTRHRPSIERETDDELDVEEPIAEPSEPPTTIQVITATSYGYAKRTSRHLYTRQRRGGMGVFDLDTPEGEHPSILALADENQTLLAISNFARGFRIPVTSIVQGDVRDRGSSTMGRLDLQENERLSVLLPIQAQGYVAMLSQNGGVRMLRHHVFGEHMKPGTSLYDLKTFGPLSSACWTAGDADLFIATRLGRGIRFPEKLVPPSGGQGIRLSEGDVAVAITPVYEDEGVFLLSSDGKGTIRQMGGFAANKTPGAGGKIALNTDHLIGAARVEDEGDIFIISCLSKIIRFPASQVPAKEGVVQGVICMTLRADEPAAIAVSGIRMPGIL